MKHIFMYLNCMQTQSFTWYQKTQPGGHMPEADLSDAKKRVSALQLPECPAASRHKKDSKKRILSDCSIEYVPAVGSSRRVGA